jgi:hypothetical protein
MLFGVFGYTPAFELSLIQDIAKEFVAVLPVSMFTSRNDRGFPDNGKVMVFY